MRQYLDLLDNIRKNGVEKESGRANMPNTWGISNGIIKMDLTEGFPLLTTKKMYWKGIVHELLWFLHGETNIKYLVDNNVNIWNGDAYRWYLKWWDESGSKLGYLRKLETIDEFVEQVKQTSNCHYPWREGVEYTIGDLGKVYGHQWRNQNGVDQVKEVLDGLRDNPYSRYHVIDAWNKADFKEMALPPCHLMYQFIVRPMNLQERLDWYMENIGKKIWEDLDTDEEYTKYFDEHNVPKFYLDLNMYQRSCDTFLGVPFNIASMSLLLMLFAKASNMVAGVSTWIGGDTHIYCDHFDVVAEQCSRQPYELPKMVIKKELKSLDDILTLMIDDFELTGYKSYPSLKAELFTGLKK